MTACAKFSHTLFVLEYIGKSKSNSRRIYKSMQNNLLKFNSFFDLVTSGNTRKSRMNSFDSFKKMNEGFKNKLVLDVVGDSVAGFFERAGLFRRKSKEGSAYGDEIQAGLWAKNISTENYLKMLTEYKEQHPEVVYIFLSLGIGDFYNPTEDVLNNAKEVKKTLKNIFPNCSKFFIIPGSGWGYNSEQKDQYPKWMWSSGDIQKGVSLNEPSEIAEYYKEIWSSIGMDVVPVKIGINKGKDGFAEPLSDKTPGMDKLKSFIKDVAEGKVQVQSEDVQNITDIRGIEGEGTREFYDILQDAINNNEVKVRQSADNYTYDPVVERAQIGLKFLGFDLPVYGADGLFGPETEKSVTGFKTKFDVPGEINIMDTNFFSALISRLREGGFKAEDINKISKQTGVYQPGSEAGGPIGDTDLGKGEPTWVYWLSHNQGAAGAAELLKVALGSRSEFSSTGKRWFMSGWPGKTNHIKGNVGDRGWDGEYKKRIKAAYDQGNDQLVAKLFTEYQKKKFDQMLERGRRDLPKHPDIKAILERYTKYFPIEFLAAVADQESNFDPNEGNSRYKGLFALDPDSDYGKKYGLTHGNVHDPEKNTEVAVKFWSDNRKQFHGAMSSNELAALGLSKAPNDLT
jgi:hypothetical protein